MKAKDTVMTENETENVRKTHGFFTPFPYGVLEKYLLAQAEISYEAGMEKVIDWLERSKKIKVPKYQLKEWGVEWEYL